LTTQLFSSFFPTQLLRAQPLPRFVSTLPIIMFSALWAEWGASRIQI